MNAVAADLLRQMAGHYRKAYDIRTDGHMLNRSQLIQNTMQMAKEYEMESEPYTFSWESD